MNIKSILRKIENKYSCKIISDFIGNTLFIAIKEIVIDDHILKASSKNRRQIFIDEIGNYDQCLDNEPIIMSTEDIENQNFEQALDEKVKMRIKSLEKAVENFDDDLREFNSYRSYLDEFCDMIKDEYTVDSAWYKYQINSKDGSLTIKIIIVKKKLQDVYSIMVNKNIKNQLRKIKSDIEAKYGNK